MYECIASAHQSPGFSLYSIIHSVRGKLSHGNRLTNNDINNSKLGWGLWIRNTKTTAAKGTAITITAPNSITRRRQTWLHDPIHNKLIGEWSTCKAKQKQSRSPKENTSALINGWGKNTPEHIDWRTDLPAHLTGLIFQQLAAFQSPRAPSESF